MLTVADLNRIRYGPELLPGAVFYSTIAADEEGTPPPLDLRRFPLALELDEVRTSGQVNLKLEVRSDKAQADLRPEYLQSGASLPVRFAAREVLGLTVANTSPYNSISNVRIEYWVWAWQPTTADKLLYRWPLTAEDEALDKELGIRASTEKGVLPLPRSYQVEREYQVIQRRIIASPDVTVPDSGSVVALHEFAHASEDEFLLLEEFRSSNTTSNVSVVISRDDDLRYVVYPTQGSLGPVRCFIPALHELQVGLEGVAGAETTLLVTVARCRLTNLLRARWGLASGLGDAEKKVKGGVL